MVAAIRWSQEQLNAYLRDKARGGPTRNDVPAPARILDPPPAQIEFTLPFLLPLPNIWQRWHWRKRSQYCRWLAAAVAPELCWVYAPYRKAALTVIRHSARAPDPQALPGSLKALADVLQIRSKRHPYGLGVLTDDNAAGLVFHVEHRKAPQRRGYTWVKLERWDE